MLPVSEKVFTASQLSAWSWRWSLDCAACASTRQTTRLHRALHTENSYSDARTHRGCQKSLCYEQPSISKTSLQDQKHWRLSRNTWLGIIKPYVERLVSSDCFEGTVIYLVAISLLILIIHTPLGHYIAYAAMSFSLSGNNSWTSLLNGPNSSQIRVPALLTWSPASRKPHQQKCCKHFQISDSVLRIISRNILVRQNGLLSYFLCFRSGDGIV